MDIMELGAIGELVGGMAVVGSLIYVGLQVRAQARESRLTTLHSHSVAYADTLDSLIGNKALREAYLKGIGDFESLDGEEHILLSAFWGKVFRFHESAFHQWRAGRLDEDTWGTFDRYTSDMVGFPGLQAWWQGRSRWFSDSFQAHITSLIERSRAQSQYPPQ